MSTSTAPSIDIRKNPLRQGARNRRGDQVDRDFITTLLNILGDTRLLLLFGKSGATLTDKSRNARVLTWSEDVSGFDTPPAELGSGYRVTLNGTDEEGDVPDSDGFSFGDGAADQPFSVAALVRFVDATESCIVAKWDATTGSELREWLLGTDGSDKLRFLLADESSDAQIGRSRNTALTENVWQLVVATYDGSGASPGIRIYLDDSRVDDTDGNSGTYTAMENTAQELQMGFFTGASAATDFHDGAVALVAVTGKALSQDEVWALKQAVNGCFGLSL